LFFFAVQALSPKTHRFMLIIFVSCSGDWLTNWSSLRWVRQERTRESNNLPPKSVAHASCVRPSSSPKKCNSNETDVTTANEDECDKRPRQADSKPQKPQRRQRLCQRVTKPAGPKTYQKPSRSFS